MRIISAKKIQDAVAGLCIQANIFLRKDVLKSLRDAYAKETSKLAREVLAATISNAGIAKKEKLAICQDTGMPVVFVRIGQDVKIKGNLKSAINKGVEYGYKKGNLRNSVVANPISRGRPGYSPAVIHLDIVTGDKVRLTVLPKGFGCENKSRLKMFKPTANIEDIKKFILDTIKEAGPDACPPYVIGVGIGGTADYASILAKKALLRNIGSGSPNPEIKLLEMELLRQVNMLNIGPMGLGGKTTVLGVNIETDS
ncbi:MAG: fumarate hydratase, partial [Candidatus Omnitrophica bacterium]|nr:fumarate hydratase [Candidatus Omnitrophota bacterium]